MVWSSAIGMIPGLGCTTVSGVEPSVGGVSPSAAAEPSSVNVVPAGGVSLPPTKAWSPIVKLSPSTAVTAPSVDVPVAAAARGVGSLVAAD